MHKTNIVLIIALVISVLAGLTLNRVSVASAQGESPVGVVVAYVPGQAITIVDQIGTQTEYKLDPMLKIEPAEKANTLGVGAFVTIIAPAKVSKDKQTATGIVVHPDVPEGWKLPGWVATPLIKNTPVPTDTQVFTTETPKAGETMIPTVASTATPIGAKTDTPLPGTTPKVDETTLTTNALVEWLRSLFTQILSRK